MCRHAEELRKTTFRRTALAPTGSSHRAWARAYPLPHRWAPAPGGYPTGRQCPAPPPDHPPPLTCAPGAQKRDEIWALTTLVVLLCESVLQSRTCLDRLLASTCGCTLVLVPMTLKIKHFMLWRNEAKIGWPYLQNCIQSLSSKCFVQPEHA